MIWHDYVALLLLDILIQYFIFGDSGIVCHFISFF